MPLYIPIWFYSNWQVTRKTRWLNYFTFQSGSIQILLSPLTPFFLIKLYIPIWFYSNGETFACKIYTYHLYIPIWFYSNSIFWKIGEQILIALHSNLVLFKFVSSYKLKPKQIFTFQSGSIQIYLIENIQLKDVTFTFQSGSIQMKVVGLEPILEEVTLHSNLVLFKLESLIDVADNLAFTFQSGSIQI